MAHNFQFLPADKLDWKPTLAARSALEIANYSLACLISTVPVLRGEAWREPEFPRPPLQRPNRPS